jgi:SWIM zinc finger
MTATQTSELERALARAQAEGIRVVDDYGDGMDRVWKVRGSGNALVAHVYTVTLARPGILSCNCQAGEHGQYCKHRATVSAYLVREP